MMDNISRIEIPVSNGYVHVYACKLSNQEPRLSEYSTVLDATELERIRSYRSAVDKRRYILAHLFLRQVLSRYTGTHPSVIRFLPSPYYNRPLLSTGEVEFSLSYRGEWAVLAVSNLDIGVDIEQHRHIDNIDQFAIDFFSAEERQRLTAKVTTEDKHRFFFRLWTLKEAYIKAISKGLTFPLTEFSILPNDENILTLYSPYRQHDEWFFKSLSVAPGYATAIACRL